MKTTTIRIITVVTALFASLNIASAEPRSFTEAFEQGKASLNVRVRYESAEDSRFADSDALTFRTRIGFATAQFEGFKFFVEAENVTAADGDSYNQAGQNPGGAGKTVIADPVGTELNQAYLQYSAVDTKVVAGRQRLVFDNARFIGDVGWRQNMQTFDAVLIQNTSIDQLTFSYAYLQQVNRIFGKKVAAGSWESNSHLVNINYAGLPVGTLTGYAYLLDFDNAAANSCATYGISLAGAKAVADGVKLSYRAEYAIQSDYGSNATSYDTDYLAAEVAAVFSPGVFGIGYEKLGSDNGVGFKTPLATAHAFNGWADLFLGTPGTGLQDIYAKAVVKLPEGFNLTGFYHEFETDAGSTDLGSEIDIVLGKKINAHVAATLKYADFSGKGTMPDVTKFWAQIDVSF